MSVMDEVSLQMTLKFRVCNLLLLCYVQEQARVVRQACRRTGTKGITADQKSRHASRFAILMWRVCKVCMY